MSSVPRILKKKQLYTLNPVQINHLQPFHIVSSLTLSTDVKIE